MQYFNLHTHQYTQNPQVLELVNQYPASYQSGIPNYSIGIHPWYVQEDSLTKDLQTIKDTLSSIHCLAVGECGLDKRISVALELQQKVLEQQLLLAQEYHKPVILHCVGAYSEIIAIKKRLKCTVPMVIHGFSKNAQVAQELLHNGFYLSFGKWLFQNPALETVFASIPEDRFFLETDTATHTIEQLYALAAKYKKIPLAQLQEKIWNNFDTVFKTHKK
ncbi:TatD family hydrolase [Flavobacterium crassostreae]|uniref:Hydrolase TatD n=1 Tax=Flavobacterium crassostreae TaxID=1763534 RepID=A0A1B9E2H4_9FLAO|nr:TatD family hydrolase [Flavobacterium crassostreae]OCB76142.1 hydrolase TatD [Flavobacterium crassostreae]